MLSDNEQNYSILGLTVEPDPAVPTIVTTTQTAVRMELLFPADITFSDLKELRHGLCILKNLA